MRSPPQALKGQLEAIAYQTEETSGIRELISAWNVAVQNASFTNPEVWKRLLATQKTAELEVKELVAGWKESARKILKESLAALPAKLAERHLDAGLAERWGKPLNQVLSEIDSATLPAQVANLPSRAQAAVAELQGKIDAEVTKIEREKTVKEGGFVSARRCASPEAPGLREACRERCRVGETQADIDTRVRAKINEGFDVEFE
jgi:ABC-type nitrate/sulfonate/bicarbonate transport system substrate-binding protein